MRKFAYFAIGLLCGVVFLGGTAVAANARESFDYRAASYITIDGTAYAHEDFAANANPEVFDYVYTREAYNTMRQTIVDAAKILADASTYRYAHYIDHGFTFNTPGKTDTAMKSVAAYISGYYTYSFGAEPTIRNLYEFPGYRILKVEVNPRYADANAMTEDFIHSLSDLTDREKVKRISDTIADRIVYKDANPAGINEIFTAASPVNGICGTYANAFIYLCQRAGIPCVKVSDATHAWNEVYVDGRWHATDISYYDVARTDASLFPANFTRTDGNPARTAFAKELLVPGSTLN